MLNTIEAHNGSRISAKNVSSVCETSKKNRKFCQILFRWPIFFFWDVQFFFETSSSPPPPPRENLRSASRIVTTEITQLEGSKDSLFNIT